MVHEGELSVFYLLHGIFLFLLLAAATNPPRTSNPNPANVECVSASPVFAKRLALGFA